MLSLVEQRFNWAEVDILTPEFRRGERDARLLKISRFGQIPALTDLVNDVNLVQSNVILTYLAEETGGFLPSGRTDWLPVQEWLSFEAARLFEGFTGVRYLSRFAGGAPDVIAHYRKHANRQLSFLNGALETCTWLVGDEPSIADISPCALTSYASEIDVDLERDFPAIAQWHQRCRLLAGYRTSESLLRSR